MELEPSYIIDWNVECCTHFGKLEDPQNDKHRVTI